MSANIILYVVKLCTYKRRLRITQISSSWDTTKIFVEKQATTISFMEIWKKYFDLCPKDILKLIKTLNILKQHREAIKKQKYVILSKSNLEYFLYCIFKSPIPICNHDSSIVIGMRSKDPPLRSPDNCSLNWKMFWNDLDNLD